MTEAEKRIAEITAQLRQAWKEDLEPTHNKVKSLEDALADTREEVRQLELGLGQRGTLPSATGATEVFKGAVFTDIAAAREAVVQGRAIDTSVIASAGKLNTEQSSSFMDLAFMPTTTLSRVPVLRMTASSRVLEELLINKRKTRAGVENIAPTPANSVSTTKRTLSTVKTILAEDITKEFLEDNIERAGAEGHIMARIAEQFGADANDLFWNGDSVSVDPFVNINDGLLKILAGAPSANRPSTSALTTAKAVLKALFTALPVQFRQRSDLAFFVPVGLAFNYADEITARATALGDSTLLNGLGGLSYFGIPLIAEYHLNGTNSAVLAPVNAFAYGIQRDITVESQYQARAQRVEYTITARTDQEIIRLDAAAMTANIPTALQ